jgi:hypothetical protein
VVAQVVDMRERGEPLDDATKSELYRRYYSALNDSETRGRMLAAIPPAQRLELQRTLLEWADLEPYKKQTVKALQAWRATSAGAAPSEGGVMT